MAVSVICVPGPGDSVPAWVVAKRTAGSLKLRTTAPAGNLNGLVGQISKYEPAGSWLVRDRDVPAQLDLVAAGFYRRERPGRYHTGQIDAPGIRVCSNLDGDLLGFGKRSQGYLGAWEQHAGNHQQRQNCRDEYYDPGDQRPGAGSCCRMLGAQVSRRDEAAALPELGAAPRLAAADCTRRSPDSCTRLAQL